LQTKTFYGCKYKSFFGLLKTIFRKDYYNRKIFNTIFISGKTSALYIAINKTAALMSPINAAAYNILIQCD